MSTGLVTVNYEELRLLEAKAAAYSEAVVERDRYREALDAHRQRFIESLYAQEWSTDEAEAELARFEAAVGGDPE